MAALKKLIITPFFGPLPEWFDKFKENFDQTLRKQGYDWLMTQDLDDFNRRCEQKLGFRSPIVPGIAKVWDYRCCLGLLYEAELEGYDFWGHCDFDMIFGDASKFVPDEILRGVDVYSSHFDYVCGCFSLYRNTPEVNDLFKQYQFWQDILSGEPNPTGWVETTYSRHLEKSGLRFIYDFPQGYPWAIPVILKQEGIQLFQQINNTWKEIMFHHFRHSKAWPL